MGGSLTREWLEAAKWRFFVWENYRVGHPHSPFGHYVGGFVGHIRITR